MYTIQTNYTFQKALGIVAPNIDSFNLGANYGPLPTDRRHLFNAAYSVNLGDRFHSNALVNGVANGWQLSGVTQLESGSNLTDSGSYTSNTDYNVEFSCVAAACLQSAAIIPGSNTALNPKGIAINNQSILGTNGQQLNPLVICNPRGGGGAHQFVNSNCFAAPTVVGQNGPNLLPAVYGPAYFDSDLAVMKNFTIKEGMKLQLRAQAYNFLNHPLWSFPTGSNLTLQFVQDPASQVITQTNANFGIATQKQGSRIVEFGAKFYF
jgi:hypothetical protein